MKKSEKRRILGALREAVPLLRENGKMLIMDPVESVLRGFYLEDSSTRDAAYVWAFVQPLYIPSKTVTLTLGQRLGGQARTWKAHLEDLEALKEFAIHQGLPFLRQIGSSARLADSPWLAQKASEHAIQARAYALGASERWQEAIPLLQSLISSLEAATGWRLDMKRRAQQLASLGQAAPCEAKQLLETWANETAKNLGIESAQ